MCSEKPPKRTKRDGGGGGGGIAYAGCLVIDLPTPEAGPCEEDASLMLLQGW